MCGAGRVKEDGKFNCEACANQQTDIAENCPGIKLNGQSLTLVTQ